MDDWQVSRLKAIFSTVLDLPVDAEMSKIKRIWVERWDSLAQVSIVSAIESEFDLSFNAKDIERITSFEGARFLVEEKLR